METPSQSGMGNAKKIDNNVAWHYATTITENNLHKLHGEVISHHRGKALTLIEGTFTDPEQRKAMKDLFNVIFNDLRVAVGNNNSLALGILYHALKKKAAENEPLPDKDTEPYWVSSVSSKMGVDPKLGIRFYDEEDVNLTR